MSSVENQIVISVLKIIIIVIMDMGHITYTYWRDKQNNGRLKKKYIRQDDPRVSYVRGLLDTLKNY